MWITVIKTASKNRLCVFVLLTLNSRSCAQELSPSVRTFIQTWCVHCHNADTTSRLNFDDVEFDLANYNSRRQWAEIYDQLTREQMPPASEPQPGSAERSSVTETLSSDLRTATLQAHERDGRVAARRLTRTEFEYSIQDLLSIDGQFAESLPHEAGSGNFDTVARNQNVSALHLEAYLATADRALDTAIRLHQSPFRSYAFDLLDNKHLNSFHERDLRVGGNISRKLEDGVAIFRDVDYLLRSDLHGFRVRRMGSGYYRITVSADAFQSKKPITMKIIVKDINGQSDLVGACDLTPGKTRTLEVDAWLSRTKVFYVAFVEDRPAAQILADIYDDGGGRKYTGPGLKVNSICVEGPVTGGWPPASTRRLLGDVEFTENEEGIIRTVVKTSLLSRVEAITEEFAAQAFRRPLVSGELESLMAAAKRAITEQQPLEDVVRIPIRTALTSPQFVMLTGAAGELDDHALASRLSYFLWKSVPDAQLTTLAAEGRLSQNPNLATQVNRMLDDERSKRFVKDFAEQWLRLNEINATTPDEKLYPEYDELLHWSVPQETKLFLGELVQNNLPLSNLIDSDFTFLNRRLALHYGIDDVQGQQFRKVSLPKDSPRGGVLTHASILKVTANGLVTSPVKRGDFVLSELFGTPPPPPPNDVGSIEPDVSKATTIRDLLEKHRDTEACSKCHRLIDPHGFALENFDPIGGFRSHYRISCDDFLTFVAHTDGASVDASGTTADGQSFNGINEYKQHLIQKTEQLARHFVSQLIVYSTGGEIEFSDRGVVTEILDRNREQEFPVRALIHDVIQSRLFRQR